MKPSYKNFEAKKPNNGFIGLPDVGAYVAEILDVRFVPADGDRNQRDTIELMIDIIEGEFSGRYMAYYKDQEEKFGAAKFKGIFRLVCPMEDDEDWRKRAFEGNLWCVEQSNPGYTWDWDEKKLKGKKVGISVRKRLYTYNGQNKETTEIGRFETVDDVRNGKVKAMKPRDQRTGDVPDESTATADNGYEDVSKKINVPW